MKKSNAADIFGKAPVFQAVFKNALPAMAAMLMVAAVSLATPVFLIFMAAGTIFGIGGTSVISRAIGEGRHEYARSVCAFCMWSCVAVGIVMAALFLIYESDTGMDGRQRGYLGAC